MVEVKITERARHYGYVIWKVDQDEEIAALLGKRNAVEVTFMNAKHGEKRIDWKYRRISVGYRWTRTLPASLRFYTLEMSKPNRLEIQCR